MLVYQRVRILDYPDLNQIHRPSKVKVPYKRWKCAKSKIARWGGWRSLLKKPPWKSVPSGYVKIAIENDHL